MYLQKLMTLDGQEVVKVCFIQSSVTVICGPNNDFAQICRK